MNRSNEIYMGHYCLSAPPAERFDAAARAGFAGLSLLWQEVSALSEESGGLPRFERLLSASGLRAPMMESLFLPTVGDAHDFASKARAIAQVSAGLGCDLVHTTALRPGRPFALLVDSLGTLAEACAEAGLNCVVEFVPYLTSVPDLAFAQRLIKAVGNPAVGLLIDSLHFFRSGAPWTELESLGEGDVLAIQVNDGLLLRPSESYADECMYLRRLPGDGEFDLARFVRTLDRIAPHVPLMAEVVNSELLARPAVDAARLIADATRSLERFRHVGEGR